MHQSPEPYDRFVRMLHETKEFLRTRLDISFITFNYDLALDFALLYQGSLGGFSYHLSDETDSQTMPLLSSTGRSIGEYVVDAIRSSHVILAVSPFEVRGG